jgi:hypothetical protein
MFRLIVLKKKIKTKELNKEEKKSLNTQKSINLLVKSINSK